MCSSAIQDQKMYTENFCLENFSYILGPSKIVVFQNGVYEAPKTLFYATNSNFHIHEK